MTAKEGPDNWTAAWIIDRAGDDFQNLSVKLKEMVSQEISL
ncbi:MAG: hypothetical protein AAGC93_29785 [Cyanobacteria bacterium P01_F01_bin.53]